MSKRSVGVPPSGMFTRGGNFMSNMTAGKHLHARGNRRFTGAHNVIDRKHTIDA